MKAIETRYKGYRFRSRLEARWAVFFDALGIRYKYEEYGYEVEGQKWLPDFYLVDTGTWAEVKGGKPTSQDAKKMGWILDFSSPLPFFTDSEVSHVTQEKIELYDEMGGAFSAKLALNPGLILLGDIPLVNHGIVAHPFITHRKGLNRRWCRFSGKKPKRLSDDAADIFGQICGKDLSDYQHIDGVGESGSEESRKFFSPDSVKTESILAETSVCDAYKKARSARFEHGETP